MDMFIFKGNGKWEVWRGGEGWHPAQLTDIKAKDQVLVLQCEPGAEAELLTVGMTLMGNQVREKEGAIRRSTKLRHPS